MSIRRGAHLSDRQDRVRARTLLPGTCDQTASIGLAVVSEADRGDLRPFKAEHARTVADRRSLCRSRHAAIVLFITCACPERDILSIRTGKERAVMAFRIG